MAGLGSRIDIPGRGVSLEVLKSEPYSGLVVQVVMTVLAVA
jgi:hypothetical protein